MDLGHGSQRRRIAAVDHHRVDLADDELPSARNGEALLGDAATRVRDRIPELLICESWRSPGHRYASVNGRSIATRITSDLSGSGISFARCFSANPGPAIPKYFRAWRSRSRLPSETPT